jgi:hypothetical protein
MQSKSGKWSGKTKMTIISAENQFRPQFWAQIVAGVETHQYIPFLGPGGHFWQSYGENQVQKIRHRIYHTILKTAKSTFVPGCSILLEATVDLEVIALSVWAPQPNSGFYIVKSATRLINSGNLRIKNPDAVLQSGSTTSRLSSVSSVNNNRRLYA